MRTHETIEMKGAAVVTKQALAEMNGVLEQIATSLEAEPKPTPVYSGLLSDGTKAEFDSFEELEGYSNRTSRRLTRLEAKLSMEKKAEDQRRLFNLEVVIGGPTACVISIDGEQRHSLHARELMQDIVERIRAGYSWMYYQSIFGGIAFFLMMACLVGSPLVGFIGAEGDSEHRRKVSHAAEMMKINPASEVTKKAVAEANAPVWTHTLWGVEYWTWLLIAAASVFVTLLIMDRLWPRIVFEIGQEIERSSGRKDKRKWFVMALLLGVPLTLLSRLLGSRLGL
jgi:hypothetical protein